MFFHLARIAKEKQPRLLLFENVKGLLSHDKGRSFETILRTLDEIGYDAQWHVLNSKDHGVPQNRERVFIIGHLRGTSRPEILPIRETNTEDTRNVGEDLSYTIDANYHKGTNTLEKGRRQLIQLNNPTHSNDRIYSDDGISPTLNTAQGGNRQPFIVAERGRYNKDGTTSQKVEARKDNVTNTLTSVEKDNRIVDGSRIRRLTVIECERLQGFPDNWTRFGGLRKGIDVTSKYPEHTTFFENISDSQRYKCIGNAVTVNVTRYIFNKLLS